MVLMMMLFGLSIIFLWNLYIKYFPNTCIVKVGHEFMDAFLRGPKIKQIVYEPAILYQIERTDHENCD